jgi:hypothetical protein
MFQSTYLPSALPVSRLTREGLATADNGCCNQEKADYADYADN